MTQDDHVSFKAPIQPNTITYLSLDGGKTIILPRKGATADGQTAQVQYVIDGEVLQSVIPATASGTTAQLQYPTANDCGECGTSYAATDEQDAAKCCMPEDLWGEKATAAYITTLENLVDRAAELLSQHRTPDTGQLCTAWDKDCDEWFKEYKAIER